ncbi:SpoIIE family protein phosphatase [Nonomuraea jiangxiensis]|uniref:Serine/threonine protein phosphatase PrpC n=1 Tax=Nonomuraea jiangxiensis TaxID=633440 RepID=A0A1G7ZFI7_9ACTN|nr:SpoIIE family protein phosphatase [Nonomuraea jiangxiensis]SDH07543.1 Serine/threonine protein phosphatase PrpC [Nonomuraea jiangxiensis]
MTFFVITFLISCLSVMTVRGRRGNWPAGMPGARGRLMAVGGTYEGSQGPPTDAYVIQERLLATAHGTGGTALGHTAAALALGAVVGARPQHAGTREQDLDECAQAAHRAVRTAALRNPATPDLVSTLDLVVLDTGERPRLRFAHVGNGAIFHCPRGREPQQLTTPPSEDGPPPRGIGLPSALDPEVGTEVGTVALRPGDRVVIVTEGVLKALGLPRMKQLLSGTTSPVACLDRLYDEIAAADPKEDATVLIADFVTA